MTHPTHEDPDSDGIERTGPDAGGGDDPEVAHAGGEGAGFLDKVKEFFTGGLEDRGSDDDVEESVDTDPEALSGWDGSGEPPELAVPEDDAVPAPAGADDVTAPAGADDATAPAGATVEDEDGSAYESRHGNGVDDSGVLADAPLADDESDAAAAADTGADEGDASRPGDSGPDEVRDGGHGWGSAAPLDGGGMPLGHPVKAWHDTMTYVQPGEDGYEDSDPHEWFVDGAAAQRAGFRPAHGG